MRNWHVIPWTTSKRDLRDQVKILRNRVMVVQRENLRLLGILDSQSSATSSTIDTIDELMARLGNAAKTDMTVKAFLDGLRNDAVAKMPDDVSEMILHYGRFEDD